MLRRSLLLMMTLSLSPLSLADHISVELKTNMGAINLQLYPEKAPKTVDNFLRYIDNGFYHGTIFHRVIDNFMIQGGGFTPDMGKKKPAAPIENESIGGLSNTRGTISMARTSNPHSATSQFFINTQDNLNLDGRSRRPGYTVFGMVTGGMDVIDKISKTRTRTVGPYQNVPSKPIIIESTRRLP